MIPLEMDSGGGSVAAGCGEGVAACDAWGSLQLHGCASAEHRLWTPFWVGLRGCQVLVSTIVTFGWDKLEWVSHPMSRYVECSLHRGEFGVRF